MPKIVRSMMSPMFHAGLAMLVIWILLATGTFKVIIDGQHLEAEVLAVLLLLAVALLFIPAACFGWMIAKMPPKPTLDDHAKVLHMKRLLERLDAEEAARTQASV